MRCSILMALPRVANRLLAYGYCVKVLFKFGAGTPAKRSGVRMSSLLLPKNARAGVAPERVREARIDRLSFYLSCSFEPIAFFLTVAFDTSLLGSAPGESGDCSSSAVASSPES